MIASAPLASSSTTHLDTNWSELTRREWEVARLISRGFTNPQIGEALTISRGTVAVHVKHILARLGMTSRAQIAVWFALRAAQH